MATFRQGLIAVLVNLALPAIAAAQSVLTGTGFFVTDNGVAVTNAHVVDGCTEIAVRMRSSEYRFATKIGADTRNDLALLRVQDLPEKTFPIALNFKLRLGGEAYVFGFPLSGILADAGNFTTGTVTSLAGLANDSSTFQISTPIQPGNSGGPVLDGEGNLIGVVVGKLDSLFALRAIKDIPQNVNFAIRSQTLESFLQSQNVAAVVSLRSQKLNGSEVAEIAQLTSIKVFCKKIESKTTESKNIETNTASQSPPNAPPSFDCSKATRVDEFTICKNPKLASLDRQLDALYQSLQNRLQSQRLNQEQWRWLQVRASCQNDETCLAGAYQSRISQLKNWQ